MRLGVFFGFIKNLGARTTIFPNVTDADGTVTEERVFGFGTRISHMVRIQPRVSWRIREYEFAGELEYTRAAFGTLNECGKVRNAEPVANTRLLFGAYYYF